MNIDKIKFVISSNERYYKISVPPLIKSLKDAGIGNGRVIVAVGEATKKYTMMVDPLRIPISVTNNPYPEFITPYNYYFVPYSSFDFTGFNVILDFDLHNEYWYLLHDTSYVGPNFLKHIENVIKDKDSIKCIPLKSWKAMNIGLYSQNLIYTYQHSLNDLKHYDLSPTGIQTSKIKALHAEDMIFNKETHNGYFNDNNFEVVYEGDFYKTGSNRRVEYYKQADFYKVKANWTGKEIGKYNVSI